MSSDRSRRSTRLVISVFGAWCVAIGLTAVRAQTPPPLENPVPATPESIELGRLIYEERCEDCHGRDGKGDGPVAGLVRSEPSDLTDDVWVDGDADGDLFRVIRDGTQTGMRGFGRTLTAVDMWHTVNFVRTLD